MVNKKSIINIGEVIKFTTKKDVVRVFEGDNRNQAQASNINGKTCRVLFMNASIHDGIDCSMARVGSYLNNKLYCHIRTTSDGEAYGVFIKDTDIVNFLKAFGLREITKKNGCTQLQLNIGKLTKTYGSAWEKWSQWGEVVDLTDRYGQAQTVVETLNPNNDGKRNQETKGKRIVGTPYKVRGAW